MARAMKVAIVDDEADMRASISQWLALSGFDTETFASAEDALKVIGPDFQGVVVSDKQAKTVVVKVERRFTRAAPRQSLTAKRRQQAVSASA